MCLDLHAKARDGSSLALKPVAEAPPVDYIFFSISWSSLNPTHSLTKLRYNPPTSLPQIQPSYPLQDAGQKDCVGEGWTSSGQKSGS